MDEFARKLQSQAQDLPQDEQRKAGKPVEGTMSSKHKQFLDHIKTLLNEGAIDPAQVNSLYHPETYEQLDEAARDTVDAASVNIADHLRNIADTLRSQESPAESPQFEQMVEELWSMKDRVEQKHGDVYRF